MRRVDDQPHPSVSSSAKAEDLRLSLTRQKARRGWSAFADHDGNDQNILIGISRFLLPSILVLVLAGCGGAPPADPATAQCATQADNDPAVEDAVLRANSPLQEVRVPGVRDEKRARTRAIAACLAAKGLGPRGGVEPVLPEQ